MSPEMFNIPEERYRFVLSGARAKDVLDGLTQCRDSIRHQALKDEAEQNKFLGGFDFGLSVPARHAAFIASMGILAFGDKYPRKYVGSRMSFCEQVLEANPACFRPAYGPPGWSGESVLVIDGPDAISIPLGRLQGYTGRFPLTSEGMGKYLIGELSQFELARDGHITSVRSPYVFMNALVNLTKAIDGELSPSHTSNYDKSGYVEIVTDNKKTAIPSRRLFRPHPSASVRVERTDGWFCSTLSAEHVGDLLPLPVNLDPIRPFSASYLPEWKQPPFICFEAVSTYYKSATFKLGFFKQISISKDKFPIFGFNCRAFACPDTLNDAEIDSALNWFNRAFRYARSQ